MPFSSHYKISSRWKRNKQIKNIFCFLLIKSHILNPNLIISMLEAVSSFILGKKTSFASHCSPSPLWKDKKEKCKKKLKSNQTWLSPCWRLVLILSCVGVVVLPTIPRNELQTKGKGSKICEEYEFVEPRPFIAASEIGRDVPHCGALGWTKAEHQKW